MWLPTVFMQRHLVWAWHPASPTFIEKCTEEVTFSMTSGGALATPRKIKFGALWLLTHPCDRNDSIEAQIAMYPAPPGQRPADATEDGPWWPVGNGRGPEVSDLRPDGATAVDLMAWQYRNGDDRRSDVGPGQLARLWIKGNTFGCKIVDADTGQEIPR